MVSKNYNEDNFIILKHSQGYTLTNENIINIDFVNERIKYIVKMNNNEIVMNDNFKDFGYPRIKTNQNIIIDLLELVNEAEKVEPKKYYLKHKYLRKEGTNYLGLNTYYNCLDVEYPDEGEFRKTQFTEDEIENLEASGFDLKNFERVEVEDE